MPLETCPLAGSVALITGAGRGIGRAVALRLARAGAATVLAARTEHELLDVAETVRASGTEALVIPTDVTSDQQLAGLVNTSLARFGHIDILVNNAGGGPPRTLVVKARMADWEWTLRVNLWATMVLTKLVLPSMIERRNGTIVNICSLAGLTGKAGEAAYAAAKFGVRGFSQSVFEEVREHGVKVSTICPGYVNTALIPPNRRVDRSKMLSPEDVAEAVYEVVASSSRCCPVEIVLHPQYDPLK
ncbi:MAG: SDR family oxidoreductase [Deltaproteobacteria bacterium]|nr:SDR family oxidoreductase [Deltaproteobacteria bacterium]